MDRSPVGVDAPIGSPDITVSPNISVTVDQQTGDTTATTGNQDQTASSDATSAGNSSAVQWRVEDGGNGHWYEAVYAGPDGVSWADARSKAEAKGAYLATITSAGENAFVARLAASDNRLWFDGPRQGPWLGGYQEPGSPEPDGGWRWVTGEQWSYSNWASGQPSNSYGNEDRLQFLGLPGPSAVWNDYGDIPGLLKPLGYIAEYDAR